MYIKIWTLLGYKRFSEAFDAVISTIEPKRRVELAKPLFNLMNSTIKV